MLLGQLYYYDKELERLQDGLENIQNVEILGIDSGAYKFTYFDEIRVQVISDFIDGMEKVFENQKYRFNILFWKYLKSVLKGYQVPQAASDFQSVVVDWVESDYSSQAFREILESGDLLTKEDDFALYYALKFLHKVLNFDNFAQVIREYSGFESGVELASDPQILVITKPHYYSLFKNINVDFLSIYEDKRLLEEQIRERISKKPISLLLLDGASEELFDFVSRKFRQELVISDFSLEGQEGVGFFDKIVKETLGVRLV